MSESDREEMEEMMRRWLAVNQRAEQDCMEGGEQVVLDQGCKEGLWCQVQTGRIEVRRHGVFRHGAKRGQQQVGDHLVRLRVQVDDEGRCDLKFADLEFTFGDLERSWLAAVPLYFRIK